MDNLKRIAVTFSGNKVGSMALTPEGLCAFEYAPEWIADGFSISPFELPLRPGVFVARPRPFGGGFGVFDDSLPDGWGMLVLDRYLRSQGINPTTLNLLDRLALVGSTGRGALSFEPDHSITKYDDIVNFDALATDAARILTSDTYMGRGIEEFQRHGGSPGGARPKVSVTIDGEEWLVKFRATSDPSDIGETEYRYSCLARRCGIEMTETRLFEGRYFGTRRFDRTSGGGRLHVVSMAGLLGADYRAPSIDYCHIFKVGMALTRRVDELWKIYRLMVFNYLIGNRDDHAKNFSFIRCGESWHFAPAYDLLPSHGMNGFHTTTFNDIIAPEPTDLVAIAVSFGLDRNEAKKTFDSIRAAIAQDL